MLTSDDAAQRKLRLVPPDARVPRFKREDGSRPQLTNRVEVNLRGRISGRRVQMQEIRLGTGKGCETVKCYS